MKTRIWGLLSLILFVAAALTWRLGEARRTETIAKTSATPAAQALTSSNLSLVSTPASAVNPVAAAAQPSATNTHPYRISNTPKSIEELTRSDSAILLRNALFDSESRDPLPIPGHLRSKGDPGSYIVQSRGPITDEFRAQLKKSGAVTVSYIPNNAYLVRLKEGGAGLLRTLPLAQAVIPYEPYYKLDPFLLPLAVAQKPLEAGRMLNVTLFDDQAQTGRSDLEALGAEFVSESRSPFGPLLTIRPDPGSLVALAQLPSVQGLEVSSSRRMLNDMSRITLGIATDPTTNQNYLDLTGTNILINLNDTGVDAQHPDLKDRVLAADPAYLKDPQGHGTHVAGILIGNGSQSASVSNAVGSVAGANFAGKAPQAKIFVLPVDLETGPLISDQYLQETAARTNAFISNNSWSYAGITTYDSSAASYDAAVRDALPAQPGSQPLLYVFPAGNSGFGNEDGTGGEGGSIESPATAKNVITVGAIDQMRMITNEVAVPNQSGDLITNQVFLAETDSSDQVTPFSSRGNIGIGTEGANGRFKPDVVAPGAFVISARSKDWQLQTNTTRLDTQTYADQQVVPKAFNTYYLPVAANAAQVEIKVEPSLFFTNAYPGLPIFLRKDLPPDGNDYDVARVDEIILPRDGALSPGDWYFVVGNDSDREVGFNLTTTVVLTNAYGTYYDVLGELNQGLAPYYRFESGTSMAAPSISGMLALMKEFFEQRLPENFRFTNSPALMKALVINGSHSLGPRYDLSPQKVLNQQGWGMPTLPTILPQALMQGVMSNSPLQFVDQNPTNAVATGESRSWKLTLTPDAIGSPLRVTLVWTDPPGNPQAAIKLVNDLDLIVAQETNEFFFGNDIPVGSDYNQSWPDTSLPRSDTVNNVENVFLQSVRATNLTVTVLGRRVNVNAVTANTNQVVQDYALVVSIGNYSLTNPFTFLPETNAFERRPITTITNGLPLLQEHIGASAPMLGLTAGATNQWNFYVFTNSISTNDGAYSITNGTNVAFVTFLPPNLSRPRNLEADIDLYVSTNPQLTNLNPAVLAAADKSTNRGGTEVVFYTNAPLDQVYYIGVKSQDQQGSEYGFVGLSSNVPFEESNNGMRIVHGMPFNVQIPDGSATKPGGALMFGIAVTPFTVGRVVVTNVIAHEDMGDLVGNLSHNGAFVVLNNHSRNSGFPSGTNLFIYDDSNQGTTLGSRPTDGPGTLLNFAGMQSSGLWLLTMVDNSLGDTGRVQTLDLVLDPGDAVTGLQSTVAANSFDYYIMDVPSVATNMTVRVWDMQPSAPLNIYVRQGDVPTPAINDKSTLVAPPEGTLSLGLGDVPPLSAGRYYIGIFNPNAFPVSYRINADLEYNLAGAIGQTFFPTNIPMPILDDAVTTSTLTVPVDRRVVDVRVGVRIDHPRISDLVLRLTSPLGTSVLLAENRGGTTTTGYGTGYGTNITYARFTAVTNLASAPIKFATPPYTNITFAEESLDLLRGEPGLGQWRLDIWDNRVGPPGVSNTPPTLVGWDLQIIFAVPATPAVTLTNGIPYSDIVVGADTKYFIVNVPRSASFATNTLVGSGDLILFGDRGGLPVGDFFIDDWYVDTNGGPGLEVLLLSTNQPAAAPLQPGQRYYLGVRNKNTGVTNTFTIRVDFDRDDEFNEDGIIALTNGVPYVATITNGAGLQYYKFDVSTNAISTLFELFPTNGDVNLLLRKKQPVVDPLPSLRTHDYYSYNPGTNAEQILLTPDSKPVPLSAGTWYLGVINLTNVPVTYTIRATEKTINIVPLTNAVPVAYRAETNALLADYFFFRISDTNASARFTISNLTGNADLVIRRGVLPTATNYDAGSFETGTNREEIIIHAATDPAINSNIFINPTLQLTNNALLLTWPAKVGTNYVLQGKTNILDAGWTNLTSTNQATNAIMSYLLPLPSPFSYFQVAQITPPATNQFVFPNLNGDWYIAVLNRETNAVDFNIRAIVTPRFITLANEVTQTNRIPALSPGHFYRYDVSTNANVVAFSVTPYDGDLQLLVRKATNQVEPWATLAGFDYRSDQPGTNVEQVLLFTNSVPVSLTNGTWYLTVLNNSTNPVNYEIVAQELTGPFRSIITLTNAVPYASRITNGIDYYQFQVSTNAAQVTFDTFGADGNLDMYVRFGLPLPGPGTNRSHYQSRHPGTNDEQVIVLTNSTPVALRPGFWFIGISNSQGAPVSYNIRATETLAGPLTNIIINPDISITASNICLSWPSTVGFRYQVQGRSNIVSPQWDDIAPVITATDVRTEYCLTRPTPYMFFQVLQLTGQVTPANNVIVLTNGVSFTSRSRTNEALTNFFLFQVVDTNQAVRFTLTNLTGNVDLVARRNQFPGRTNYDAGSFETNLLAEDIFIRTNASATVEQPVEDLSVAVRSNALVLSWTATNGVSYRILGQTNVASTNWIEVTNLVAASTGLAQYAISLPAPYLWFEVVSVAAEPADLVLPNLNGNWYLAVLNRDTTNVDYTIRASVTPHITPLTNGIAFDAQLPATTAGQYYRFEVSSNASLAAFTVIPQDGDVQLLVRRGTSQREPWPTLEAFDYRSDTSGSNAEQVVVFTNSVPAGLTQGTWYLAVLNKGTNPVNYQVSAWEMVGPLPLITTLTNGLTYNSRLTNGLDYYLFQVSSNATQVLYETFAASGNVDLYARWGLPLPGPGTNQSDYQGVNPGTNDERIVVLTNSTPVRLRPGYWFLGVSNAQGAPVDYSVRATETVPQSTNIVVINPDLSITNNQIRLAWDAIIGARYHVEGKSNIVDQRWDILSPTMVATNVMMEYFISLPTPYQFFQVIQELGEIPSSATNLVTLTNGVPFTARVSANSPLTNFFLFRVADTNSAVRFVLKDLSGNVDLVARLNQYPSATNYDAGSFQTNRVGEDIYLQTNTVSTAGQSVSDLALAVRSNALVLSWTATNTATYRVLGFTNVMDTNEVALGQVTPATNGLTQFIIPLPSPYFWFNVVEIGSGPSDGVTLTNLNGDWYLAVLNRETNAVDFTIRAVVTPSFMTLSNAVAQTNQLPAQTAGQYYQFQVSSNASLAVFTATPFNGDLQLLVRKALPEPEPWPTLGAFDYRSNRLGTNAEQVQVFTNSQPVGLTNGTWYVAVLNNETNPVSYRIEAEELAGALPQLVPLTNSVPFATRLTNGLDYYQFQVASNATQAAFETFGADGNVDLYIWSLSPASPPDYQSRNAGTNDERVLVQTSSVPVPLHPGIWFAGVSNAQGAPVSYSIRVTQTVPPQGTNQFEINPDLAVTSKQIGLSWTSVPGALYHVEGKSNIVSPQWDVVSPSITASNTVTQFFINLPSPYSFFQVIQESANGGGTETNHIVVLTNGVPVSLKLQPGAALTNFFLFTVSDTNPVVQFLVSNASGNVDLVARRDQLPGANTNQYDVGSFKTDQARESITLRTSPAPVGQLAGDFKINVSSNYHILSWSGFTDATYRIVGATTFTGQNGVELDQVTPATNGLTQYYVPLPVPYVTYYVEEVAEEPANLVQTNLNGNWYVGVLNRESNAVDLTIQAIAKPSVTPLADGIVLSNTLPAQTSGQYFRFDVSNTSTQVVFTVTPLDGDLQLLARQRVGVLDPWPTLAVYDYRSDQPGTNVERIIVATNSQPVALTFPNETWYLAVLNKGTNPVNYRIQAATGGVTDSGPTNQVTDLVVQPVLNVASNSFCLSWSSTTGEVFTVEGRVNVNDSAWNILATNIVATGLQTTYCVPLTNVNRFFRVVVNQAKASPASLSNGLLVNPYLDPANHSFCMSWSSVAGREYHVQGKQNLADTAWIAVSPTIQASGSVTSFCLPMSGEFATFQVVEGPASGGGQPARLMSSELIQLRNFEIEGR